jgi:hypothetical protein
MPRAGSVKTLVDVRSLARSHTVLAINTLSGLARSPKVASNVRLDAAVALLDRGWGKPDGSSGDGNSGEIRVIIRQIVEPRDAPRVQVIEHDALTDADRER